MLKKTYVSIIFTVCKLIKALKYYISALTNFSKIYIEVKKSILIYLMLKKSKKSDRCFLKRALLIGTMVIPWFGYYHILST